MIEILVTMSIMTAVSVVGYLAFSNFRSNKNLELTANEVSSVLRATQKRAITQESGRAWGVRFFGSTSTTPSYQVASGTSYSAGAVDRTYYLGRNMLFGNPGGSSTLDIFFSAISGKLVQNQIVSLNTGRSDGFVNDIIVDKQGSITIRKRTGVVGYWHLDENTASTTYDASGFSNTGTLTNGPTWAAASNCKAGACLNFDGTDDFVDVADTSLLEITKTLTIEAWIKRDVLDSAYREIVRKGNPYFLVINGENELAVGINDFHYTDGYLLSGTGSWEYVAATYDDDNNIIKIYLNGNLVHSVATTQSLNTTTDPLRIGNIEGGVPNQGFDGLIDEVRVYNRVLTSTDILNHYNDLR